MDQMKRNYPNSVVLVRIGRFYEVFHRDVDILVDIGGGDYGLYMCGKIAWSGFPANVLEKFTNKFNEAGYHVIKTFKHLIYNFKFYSPPTIYLYTSYEIHVHTSVFFYTGNISLCLPYK